MFRDSLKVVISTIFVVSAFAATPGSWVPTGSMNVARGGHIQVRLSDGRVLVAGGLTTSSVVTASAEILNPATGLWSLTGSLITERQNASALLLPNGKVLVAGGSNESGQILSSVEIYDPVQNAFTAGASMLNARTAFAMVALKSGLIMAAGGCPIVSCSGTITVPLKSTELYNPATGTWTATGDMDTARYSPSAVLLASGKVFLTANLGINVFTQFDIYDPTTGVWTAAGPSLYPAPGIAVGLANGRVLTFYGGPTYLYDPVANTFTAGPAMAHSQIGPSALLMRNGDVMVAGGGDHTSNGGGRGGSHTVSDGISEVYYPALNAFAVTAAGGIHNFDGVATELLNDQILLTGGMTGLTPGSAPTTVAELYSPATETLLPQPLSFGGRLVGQAAAAKAVTLHNATSAPLAVTGVSTTGSFTQTNNCIGNLAANANCQVQVSFNPTTTGALSGSLNVALGDSPFSDSTTLTGTGLLRALSANPSTFKISTVAGTQKSGTVTLTNVLSLASTVSVGISGSGFSQTNNCPASLAPAAKCVVTVNFAPTAVTSYPGTLTFGGAGGTVQVPLTGTGAAVLLSVSPSLNFGVVAAGDDTALDITVQNSTPVAFSFTVAGPGDPYTITNNCPASVAAGSSCTVNVDFAPNVAGTYNTAVTLTDNNGHVYTVSITASSAVIN